MRNLLNDSQWNSVRISLVSLEKRLRQAQVWLDGLEEQGTVYHRRLSISEEDRQHARQEIDHALQILAGLGAALGLPFQEEDVGSELRGEMTVSWANLLDSRARKLVRFGEVDPRLAGELDPYMEQLADIANELSAIFGGEYKENP